jgi:uncharacterized membrane protein
MPMIACPDCGWAVSDSAATCPHCGRPIAPAQAVRDVPAGAYAGAQPFPGYAQAPVYVAPSVDPLADARSTVQLGYIMLAAAFVFGPLWIVAGVLGYTKRDAVRGTWLESHCNWLLDTLWVGLAGIFIAIPVMFVFMFAFMPMGFMGMMALGLGLLAWHIYRLVRGWMLFGEGKPAVGVLSPPRW